MNTFLKVVMVVCIGGIAAVLAIGALSDSDAEETPASIVLAPTVDSSTPPPAGPASEPEPVLTDEPSDDPAPAPVAAAPSFRIEELTAECRSDDDDFAVTALPLGTDWRVTERGVYKNSPVTITCETSGASEGLVYDWTADEGEIEGSGASIVWTAPDHGAKVKVSVMVRDSFGVEELAALNFRVATCECVYKRYE